MLSKIVFAFMLLTGQVEPMNETNDERDLYYLYVLTEEKKVHVYEHAYQEEILYYIETGEFSYNEALVVVDDKLVMKGD